MTRATLNLCLTLLQQDRERRRSDYQNCQGECHEVQITAEKRLAEVNRAISEVGEEIENRG